MRYSKREIMCRIQRLKTNPVENAKLIKKWERMLRHADAEEVKD